MLALIFAFVCGLAGCNKPSSDNIQLWKTTEKGPERLHETLADHRTPPRLRAEAAVALVDIGRADEVDTTSAAAGPTIAPRSRRQLEPLYEVAMKDPSPDKALSARDALYSLRQFVTPDDQKRIDAALLPALEAESAGGPPAAGPSLDRQDADRHRLGRGRDAGARAGRARRRPFARRPTCSARSATRRRARRAAPRWSRGRPKPHRRRTSEPDAVIYKALGAVGGPSAVKFLEEKVTAATRTTRRWPSARCGERRDPAVLPFAIKIASDPKARQALRDEMFGVIEAIGGLEAQKGLARHHLVRQGRDRALPRLRVDAGGAQGRRDPAGAGGVPGQRRPTRRSTSTICW